MFEIPKPARLLTKVQDVDEQFMQCNGVQPL